MVKLEIGEGDFVWKRWEYCWEKAKDLNEKGYASHNPLI
jgi:hypothetical protein